MILNSLFKNQHPKLRKFFERIRAYNSTFSFASFNANVINLNNTRFGSYYFEIQGQIDYKINTSLLPTNERAPRFGQSFILDSRESIEHRKLEGNFFGFIQFNS